MAFSYRGLIGSQACEQMLLYLQTREKVPWRSDRQPSPLPMMIMLSDRCHSSIYPWESNLLLFSNSFGCWWKSWFDKNACSLMYWTCMTSTANVISSILFESSFDKFLLSSSVLYVFICCTWCTCCHMTQCFIRCFFQKSIPSLIEFANSNDNSVQLSSLQALTNLSVTPAYHAPYTRVVQSLYEQLDSQDGPVRMQVLKLLVNLSSNPAMVPHLLAAKVTCGSPYSIHLRTFTWICTSF